MRARNGGIIGFLQQSKAVANSLQPQRRILQQLPLTHALLGAAQQRYFLTLNKAWGGSALPYLPSYNIYTTFARGFKSSQVLNRKDFYNILGVGRNSSSADIKKAYFQKAKQYHPDVNKTSGAQEKFAEINEAYETLGDEQKKRVYDQTGMTGD